MRRDRDWEPVPHDALQADQSSKGVVTQSWAHCCELQPRACVRSGHSSPPCSGLVSTSRARLWRPPPQLFVQPFQRLHGETSQWIGHGPRWQVFDSSRCGHALPPWLSKRVTRRVRCATPSLHVAEHAPHSDHCETAQSTAHGMVLHAWSSASALHDLPPLIGCTVTLRVRVLVPDPQK
jgi:hypothetical protein